MKRFFSFLGSIHLALFLLISTLLFVIAGTFLESIFDSHKAAAKFTYSNPIFIALLWGYFVNILFATLKRLPFQRRHIPFLLTHAGLLMTLLGLLIKSHIGVQGTLLLSEGEASDKVLLRGSYALHIETRENITLLPLGKKREFSVADLEFKILHWFPHSEEKLEGFVKKDHLYILGFPPIPICAYPSPSLKTATADLYVLPADSTPTTPPRPSLYFQEERVLAFDGTEWSEGEVSHLIFDRGYLGYGIAATSPIEEIELITPLSHGVMPLPPHKKQEELTPALVVQISDGKKEEVVHLAYERSGQGFKWPVLEGKVLVRFQPMQKKIPHKIRLREGRRLNYLGSEAPYSYESDLLINEREKTISMNRVYQSKKGYRFYMSALHSAPRRANQVQIVVNHDPVRYLLTYPGAAVLALGIALLYIRRAYE